MGTNIKANEPANQTQQNIISSSGEQYLSLERSVLSQIVRQLQTREHLIKISAQTVTRPHALNPAWAPTAFIQSWMVAAGGKFVAEMHLTLLDELIIFHLANCSIIC
jgi:hypothetical protein